jgi:hypothetical protein
MGSLPFAGTVSDSLDMVRKIWGVSGLPTIPTASSMVQFAQNLPQTLPSMIAPTLDVEEIDRRIADLRAVEQWLNLNVSMLHTTIQSLEVQRNTIATLRSFGGVMLSTMSKPGELPAMPVGATAPVTAPAAAPTLARRRSKHPHKSPAAVPAGTLPLNPAAWWNTLQEQFTKVAAAAASAEKKKIATSPASKSKRRKRLPD